MKRARLLRYARCQMSDYALERGLIVLIIAILNIASSVITLYDVPPEERILSPGGGVAKDVLITFGSLVLLAVLFSSQELIGRPRKLGYYRLTFAKPVSPVAFYAQLFVVHLIGTVVLISLISALFSVIAVPVPIWGIAALTGAAFILIGGIGFLASAFLNYDSLIVIVAIGVSFIVKKFAAAHPGVGEKFANLLVPVDHLHAMSPLLIGETAAGTDVAWVLGYGLTTFVLGLFAVRHSQLAD